RAHDRRAKRRTGRILDCKVKAVLTRRLPGLVVGALGQYGQDRATFGKDIPDLLSTGRSLMKRKQDTSGHKKAKHYRYDIGLRQTCQERSTSSHCILIQNTSK